jgi:hypothetical protein
MKKETKKAFEHLRSQQEIASATAELSRSRAITVGTAFGGTTELSMRGGDGTHLWCIMQPVEVIEFIHQLAANVGCHIYIKPRKDFASWRAWEHTEEEKIAMNGHPFFANDMAPHQNKGAILPPPEQQPGLKFERNKNEPMAIKKTVKRRSTKRTAAAA